MFCLCFVHLFGRETNRSHSHVLRSPVLLKYVGPILVTRKQKLDDNQIHPAEARSIFQVRGSETRRRKRRSRGIFSNSMKTISEQDYLLTLSRTAHCLPVAVGNARTAAAVLRESKVSYAR